jgi:hypothetical protein
VRSLVTEDVTYVSFNYETPDLHSIMPWWGTHDHGGPESIVQAFVDVARYWTVLSLSWRRCSARASTPPCSVVSAIARRSCPK